MFIRNLYLWFQCLPEKYISGFSIDKNSISQDSVLIRILYISGFSVDKNSISLLSVLNKIVYLRVQC